MSNVPNNNTGNSNGPSYEDFWADETERSKAMDDVLRENAMGGFDPKYANLDVSSDDEADDDTSKDDDDDEPSDDKDSGEST